MATKQQTATGAVVTEKELRFVLNTEIYENEIDCVVSALNTAGFVVIKPEK